MNKKVFRRGLVAVSIGTVLFTQATAAELRGIGLSSAANSAQLTLDLTDAAPQKIFTLDHPDRIVIDLPHTQVMHGVRAPGPTGVVTSVRFGSQPHGTLRIAIELRSAFPVHSAWVAGTGTHDLTITIGEPMVALATAAAAVKLSNTRSSWMAVEITEVSAVTRSINHAGRAEIAPEGRSTCPTKSERKQKRREWRI